MSLTKRIMSDNFVKEHVSSCRVRQGYTPAAKILFFSLSAHASLLYVEVLTWRYIKESTIVVNTIKKWQDKNMTDQIA